MRVLVVRPEEDAQRTAAALGARGHEAVIAPVLRIEMTNETPPAGAFDGIVVTSVNAVAAMASRRDLFADVPLFAVGQRTASALRAAGLGDAATAEGDGRSLSELIRRSASAGGRLLHVAGRDHKAEPQASLAAAGFRIATWTAYEALAVPHLPVVAMRALHEGSLDAALHYSRRSAAILLRLAGAADVTAPLMRLPNLCLSADVAAPLQQVGARVAIAPRPDESALLAVLDEVAEKCRRAGSPTTRSG